MANPTANTQTAPIELHAIQQQVQTNGAFSPLHWLLDAGYLPYSHYEDWRYGRRKTLDGAYTLADTTIEALLESAAEQSEALKLSGQAQHFYSWQGDHTHQALVLSARPNLANYLSQRWLRPEDIPQLDLFMDNGATETENTLVDAIAHRQWPQAEALYKQLCEQAVNNNRLADFETLILYGTYLGEAPEISEEDASEELAALEEEISPVARELMRHNAKDYLAEAWLRQAKYLPKNTFDPEHPTRHTSYAYAQLPDWPKVIDAIVTTPNFHHHASLLARLAQAYWHENPELALLVWSSLAWHKGEDILDQISEPRFKQAWNQFWELDQALELFPAWLLIAEPGILSHLDALPYPLEENTAFKAVENLLKEENQDKTDIEGRKALQEASPVLLKCYLDFR